MHTYINTDTYLKTHKYTNKFTHTFVYTYKHTYIHFVVQESYLRNTYIHTYIHTHPDMYLLCLVVSASSDFDPVVRGHHPGVPSRLAEMAARLQDPQVHLLSL